VTSTDGGAEITIEAMHCGEATRTIGFWKTHYQYSAHVYTDHLGETMDLGWVQLDSVEDVMGMLWADVAKNSTGAKRDKLCQARASASQQAVAAILNSALVNGASLPVSLAEIASTLGGTDIDAIRSLGEDLDGYNNSGDNIDIVDPDGYEYMSATPQAGQSIDTSIADCSSAPDKGKDLSPALYGFVALAAGLAVLVPIRMLRSRRRTNL